ncbi:MAG: phosphatase [Planctomycetota bacterium]
MNIVDGDLIELGANGAFDVIVHGCNCFNTMGAGIAKLIKDRFPEAYEVDLKTEKGDRGKLGTITTATVECDGRPLTIVNAYTQFDFRRVDGVVNADYDAIRRSFSLIKTEFGGQRIGYPMIGAGLAGGDWDVISQIIDDELVGENHTLVRFKP